MTMIKNKALVQFLQSTQIGLESLWKDVRGVSAVEFALIAPLLVGIYLGAAETSLGVSVNRKVSRVSSTMSDLVAQAQVLTAADIDTLMNVSAGIMDPVDTAPLKITVTGVNIDSNRVARVIWSRARNATKKQVGTTYPIPDKIKLANSFIVVAEVKYDYVPTMGSTIVGTLHFDKRNYLRPRVGANVSCTGC